MATPRSQSNAQSSAAPPLIPKPKLTAVERFMRFARREKKSEPEFPPPLWKEEERQIQTGSTQASPIVAPPLATPATEDSAAHTMDPPQVELNVRDSDTFEGSEPVPEPATLAKRIQAMISSLPSFTPSNLSAPPSRTHSPPATPSANDPASQTPDPSRGSFIADSKLISLLSSASIMNGSIEKGRQSVWSILDHLRSPHHKGPNNNESDVAREGVEGNEGSLYDTESSVMMYGPLEPDEGSEVEIARSEIMSMYEDEAMPAEQVEAPAQPTPIQSGESPERISTVDSAAVQSSAPVSSHGLSSWWKGKQKEEVQNDQNIRGSEDGTANKPKQVKEVRVWFPSTTRISVQATWWGFRIYLPPPVLDVLNNKQFEAAKRAAIITTALKWLLDHIPVKLMPIQFRPAVLILKRLVPYLGYMGVFIAWSWSAIKTFDKGYGVILTATWLAPLALIPGTWEADMVPPPTSSEIVSN